MATAKKQVGGNKLEILKVQSEVKKESPSQVELTIKIPQIEIERVYQDTLTSLAKEVEIKGFRKGAAPLKLVEEKLGRTFVLRKASESLIVVSYLQAVKKHQLVPIADPQLTKAVTPEKEEWQLTFKVPLLPKVELPEDYLYQLAKRVKNKAKIITPNEAKEPQKNEETKRRERLNKTLTALIEIGKVNLPQTIIETEVNKRLANLVDQVQKLQMTLDDYLKSKGITGDQLRQSLRKQVGEEYKLDFLLAEVAKKEKIEVSEKEVESILAKQPQRPLDKHRRQEEENYVRNLLLRSKILSFLLDRVEKEKVVITP